MRHLKSIFIITLLAALALQACNLPEGVDPNAPDFDLTVTANAVLIETALASGELPPEAQGLPSTEDPALPPTEEVVIPAAVLPPAVGDVTVTVSVATNCRQGPGAAFASVYGMPVGQVAKVVAKNSYSGYWIIEIPGQNGQTCWLWGQYATISGDTASLKDVVTPTSAATLKPTATNTAIASATATSTTAAGAPALAGCTNPTASNYNPAATVDDGSCIFTAQATILGCTDPKATNYNSLANADDGSCTYPVTKPNAPIIVNSSVACVDQNDGNFEFQVIIDWADNSDNETVFGWSRRVEYNSNIINQSGGRSNNTASPNTHREFTGIYPAGAIFIFNVSASNSAGESSNSVSLTCP